DGIRNAYLNYSFNPIFEDGRIAGLFGSIQDVTGEVVALRQLAESEARASRILQSIGDAVIVTDEDACVTTMNHVAEALTGWSVADARGQLLTNVFQIIDEKSRQPVESPANKVRRLRTIVGLATNTILIRKDGTETAIDDSSAPIWDNDGKLTGIVLVFRDITERKSAEKASLQERAKLLEIIQQAPVFFALLQGPNHVFSMVNPLYERLVNFREVLNKPVRLAVPEAVDQGYIDLLDKVYQGEPFVGNGLLFRFAGAEGLPATDRYMDFVYQPLREPDGHVSGIIVIGVDVTDQRKAQNAALQLAAIVDSSYDVIISKDLNGIVTSWNPSASRLFGYSAEEMVGASILKVIPEHLYSDENIIIENIRAGRRLENFETVRRAKDGRLVDVSLTISPIRDAEGRVIGASKILRDISERKRVELSLIQAEKIAATGRMAATIAHEVNNPLEAVMNLLYLLRSKVTDPEGLNYLSTAEGELGRVSHITKQTLGYYREHAAASPVSLSELVQHAVSIYEPRCTAADIEISTFFQSSRKLVMRRGEIMQVISNLIANSIYAMSTKGQLLISVEDTTSPSEGVLLTITDNGAGIADCDLPKIFDAFFSTRATVGTGIGLFVAKGFVEGHGGQITVDSETNPETHGTTFHIFLPLHTLYESKMESRR
ncbi:MAG: PAS domain S-box protein, partial [Bryocella sp.]